MPLGIYISVPFCKTKCSYCNFASDVFSGFVFEKYVDRVCSDIGRSPQIAADMGGKMENAVDSIYLGGGTPTLLQTAQLDRIFTAVRSRFEVLPESEITVECAPGTMSALTVETLLSCGVNRVSLGVQSFVDQEAAAVGRLHKRETVLKEIARLRAAGITNINIDLIAGLPHQTAESWGFSLAETLAIDAPHVSVYMLEVDDDSRLGRELLAGGTRYHAHFVPDDEATTDFYLAACARFESAGIMQYEISNFARKGFESSHNNKYWTRQPYLGFGVDAHSMLLSATPDLDAVRFSAVDSLEEFVSGSALQRMPVSRIEALEESFFLGLRLNQGVRMPDLFGKFGADALNRSGATIAEFVGAGLLERRGDVVRLTSRGRLLSNEVFEKFIQTDESPQMFSSVTVNHET